jgi:glycosyltransferase involved in cell wall biosynthesis
MKTAIPGNLPPAKPTLVVVSNGTTPYGTHFLRRVAKELPNINLRTIYSYEFSMGRWEVPQPPSIHAVILGKGENAAGRRGIAALWSGWRRYRQIAREIRAANPAALMIGYGYVPHILTIEWCHRKGIPFMLMGDSNILGDRPRGFKAWFKKLVVSRWVSFSRAILPCGTLGSQYYQKYGASPDQIFFMPVEPDYTLIENVSRDDVESLSTKFRLDPRRRRFIYSGRLVEYKRVDLLIEAFAQVADRRPDWDLMIAGGGPLEDRLKAGVPDRLRQRILWTGFVGSPQRVSALYRLADVLVLPSDFEPWALVVNEAACAGLALICSDVVGAAAELLRDRENGRLFRTGDIASLVDALLDATEEANLRRYQAASPEILKDWRKRADPVQGLRRALEFCLQPAKASAIGEIKS